MESPGSMKKFVVGIRTAKDRIEHCPCMATPCPHQAQLRTLIDEATEEHKRGLAARICGTSLENKIYHKLLHVGLIREGD